MEMKITWSTLAKQQLKDDFRTKAQAPLADQNSGRAIASPATSLALMLRVSVPYKGNRRTIEGLGSGIRTPSSQEGDRGVEKSASSDRIGLICG